MPASGVARLHGTERAWTEHLATDVGAAALLDAVGRASLPLELTAAVDAVRAALVAGIVTDEVGTMAARPSEHVTHQLHLDGRYPDVVVHDLRGRVLAVVEAQRRRADDRHIAKLAAHYVPESGARLGVLVTEGWGERSAHHPAWARCAAPVVVVVASDSLHELDYRPAWVHRPIDPDLG